MRRVRTYTKEQYRIGKRGKWSVTMVTGSAALRNKELTMSNGATVQAIKKPAPNAEQNWVRMPIV